MKDTFLKSYYDNEDNSTILTLISNTTNKEVLEIIYKDSKIIYVCSTNTLISFEDYVSFNTFIIDDFEIKFVRDRIIIKYKRIDIINR